MPGIPPRLVVVEQIVFQPAEQEATVAVARFARFVKTDEQPYVRRGVRATATWQPLDKGWITKASMLVVENTGKTELMVAIVVDGAKHPFAVMRSGSTQRFEPSNLVGLWVATTMGETTYTITLFPDED